MTLTEALQETKTLKERIQKKRERLTVHLARTEATRDLLEDEGGQKEHLKRELQSIEDLEQELLSKWHSITTTNAATQLVVEEESKTLEDWIRWKVQVAPLRHKFIESVLNHLQSVRNKSESDKRQYKDKDLDPRVFEIVSNVDEKRFRDELEWLEKVLGSLDAKLSVKNATTQII